MITRANSAMADSATPNTLNLWAVYAAVQKRKADGCGVGTDPVSLADWSREELDRVGQKIGAIEFDNCPYGFTQTFKPGEWEWWDDDPDGSIYVWFPNHDLTGTVVSCWRNGSIRWKWTDGVYNDKDPNNPDRIIPAP